MKLNDDYLKQVCLPVPQGDDVSDTIKGMLALCYGDEGEQAGLGLAANQAGLTQRIIVVSHGLLSDGLINPVIEKYRGGIYKSKEGCLSFPGEQAVVMRHKIVKVSWFNSNWEAQTRTFRGLLAAIIQHEVDHLDGISIFDRQKLGVVERRG